MKTSADSRIFSGIKVLDFTQYLAGPTITRFMAELGAEIVKIEIAPGGDPARMLPLILKPPWRWVWPRAFAHPDRTGRS